MTLLKTIHQWDINTEENLAAFKRESLEILQKVDRTVYIRTLITDAECLLNPYCDREEFINWITEDSSTGSPRKWRNLGKSCSWREH